MRVVQIGATYVGAQEKIESAIHNYLKKNGHKSYILYAIGNSEEPDIIRYENLLENLLRRGLLKIAGKNPHCAVLSTLRLICNIERFNPDVAHLHILHHGYIDYIMLLKYLAKKKIPVVYTLHDMWAFTGGCYYYFDVQCNSFQTGCSDCPKKTCELDCRQNKTGKYFETKMQLFKKLNKICFVSVSKWVNEEVIKSGIGAYPQYIVWNAIENNRLITSPVKKETDKFYIIGVAANWGERKGISRFIELGKALDDRFRIILVGEAGESVKMNAPDNIVFFGKIEDKIELYNIYAGADINLSMSLEETFGLTFLEAALTGTKSIGLRSTAVPEIIGKVNGYVVAPKVGAVVDLLNILVENREACKLTDAQVESIRNKFSAENMAKHYLGIYREMTLRKEK